MDFLANTLKFDPQNLFSWILTLPDTIHCCKLSLYESSRKTNEPYLRKWQKETSFKPDFGPFGPNLGTKFFSWILPLLDVRHCCKLSLYAISRKNNKPNMRKLINQTGENGKKIHPGPEFGPNLVHKSFFVDFASTRFYTLLQAINEPNLRKWQKN